MILSRLIAINTILTLWMVYGKLCLICMAVRKSLSSSFRLHLDVAT